MFFEFRQINSGGRFLIKDNVGIGPNVWIEAPDYILANAIAEDIGIYFDGVANGLDCPCCGDRWYRTTPRFDVKWPEVSDYSYMWHDTVYIHKLDGTLVKVKKHEAENSPHVTKLDY